MNADSVLPLFCEDRVGLSVDIRFFRGARVAGFVALRGARKVFNRTLILSGGYDAVRMTKAISKRASASWLPSGSRSWPIRIVWRNGKQVPHRMHPS